MSPYSIQKSYLPNIVNDLKLKDVRSMKLRQAINSETVKMVIKGFMKIYDKENPKMTRTKVAFTLQMVEESRRILILGCNSEAQRLKVKRVVVAMKVGIFFLLRRSEFLKCASQGKTRAGLRIDDVHFFRRDGRRLLHSQIGIIPADQVFINVLFSKMDQKGRGRVLRHVRQVDRDTCIVQELEMWVSTLREKRVVSERSYFFSLPGEDDLTSDMLSTKMKECCVGMGIRSHLVSCHSLRYGGATMLAAAGLPYYIIAYYGGWTESSQTLPLYTQPGRDSAERVSAAMAMESRKGLADTFIRDYIQMKNRVVTDNVGSNKIQVVVDK